MKILASFDCQVSNSHINVMVLLIRSETRSQICYDIHCAIITLNAGFQYCYLAQHHNSKKCRMESRSCDMMVDEPVPFQDMLAVRCSFSMAGIA